jgi:Tfp pilus assembly protein PilF
MPSVDLTARMHFDQGRTLFGRQEFDSAADQFKLAVERDPKFTEAHRYLAETFEKLGYRHRAKKAWEALLRISTDSGQQKEIKDRLAELG